LSAPALTVADGAFQVPSIYADNYVDEILKICEANFIKGVFSLNDLELPILAAHRSRFDKIGTNLVVSDSGIIDICFDKLKTFAFAKQLNILTPKTFSSLVDAKTAIFEGNVRYPLVVKPRWGSGSIGIEFPEDDNELDLAYALISKKINRTILSVVSARDEMNAVLIQEKIIGKEYGLDILNDLQGQTRQVFIKEKLSMRAGETDKSVLRDLPDLELLTHQLGNALGHIGNLDCDFLEQDGQFYLLEMNPRFGGGYPFTHLFGGNYVQALLSWLRGDIPDFSLFKKDYGKVYAKYDRLLLTKTN
jgi:carbamoyl-phosphate synthase large subunit